MPNSRRAGSCSGARRAATAWNSATVLSRRRDHGHGSKTPNRLHHKAYVSRDLEATRKFYEDIIGLPLLATWCEKDVLFGAERTYCHCFFGLGDGGALAFFQFADPEDQEQFGPKMPFSPFHHIALQGGPGDAGRHREAPAGGGVQGAADLRARARLLPLACTPPTRTA